MSRHRKTPPPTAPARRPQPAPQAPAAAMNGTALPHDATAALLQVRAAIAALRRDVNARLDALDRQVEALLPHHPAVPPQPTMARETVSPASSEPTVARAPATGIKVGDQVYVPSLGGTYTVVEAAADGRTFKVQANQLRVHVRAGEMWRLDENEGAQTPAAKATKPALNAAIPEIDLHGYTEDEALVTLELFCIMPLPPHPTRTRHPRQRERDLARCGAQRIGAQLPGQNRRHRAALPRRRRRHAGGTGPMTVPAAAAPGGRPRRPTGVGPG